MKRVELEKWLESNLTSNNLLCLYNYFYQKVGTDSFKDIDDFLDKAPKSSKNYLISPMYPASKYEDVKSKVLSSIVGYNLEEDPVVGTPIGIEVEKSQGDVITLVHVDTNTLCEYITNHTMNILRYEQIAMTDDPIECLTTAMNLVR